MKISLGYALILIYLLSDKKFLMLRFIWKKSLLLFLYEFVY